MTAETQEGRWPQLAFSGTSDERVIKANVLMVGAGGIGCELVKTLVLTGFRNITMVDMDTIEISNLNRQFLFRKRHVGKSKAAVAAEAVKAFCPAANITTMQDNVKESKFDIAFIRTFDMILNGLDNVEARRHVNRLCLAADRPLIESGTTGYKGQVTVHLKGRSECYECTAKPPTKGFPICTIRNTPDKPIHCIVWAKDLLFERVFGPPEAVTDLDEVVQNDVDGHAAAPVSDAPTDEADKAAQEADAAQSKPSEFLRGDGEDAWAYAQRLYELCYRRDIIRVARIEKLWEQRAPPTPLPPASEVVGDMQPPDGVALAALLKHLQLNPRKVWTIEETAKAFICAIYLFHKQREELIGTLHFTKDDDASVIVVAAAANLRAHCYGISTQSEFDAKGMAGNIIHAIATTNAIISGFIVVEALKVLNKCTQTCRNIFLSGLKPNDYGKLSVSMPLVPPNKSCMACGEAIVNISVPVATFTLSALVTKVLKGAMAFSCPTVMAGSSILYEEGEDLDDEEALEYAENMARPIADLPGGGIRHNASVSVTDQTQDLSVTLVFHDKAVSEDTHPEGFILEGTNPVVKTSTATDAPTDVATGSKRKADDDLPSTSTKKAKLDDVVVIDDDDDAIEIE